MHRRVEAPSTVKKKGDRQEDEDGLTSLEIPSTVEMEAKQPFKREQQARAEEEDTQQLWTGTIRDGMPLNVVGREKKWVFRSVVSGARLCADEEAYVYNDDSLCCFDSRKSGTWCD